MTGKTPNVFGGGRDGFGFECGVMGLDGPVSFVESGGDDCF